MQSMVFGWLTLIPLIILKWKLYQLLSQSKKCKAEKKYTFFNLKSDSFSAFMNVPLISTWLNSKWVCGWQTARKLLMSHKTWIQDFITDHILSKSLFSPATGTHPLSLLIDWIFLISISKCRWMDWPLIFDSYQEFENSKN